MKNVHIAIKKLGKTEMEVSRWLSGTHDLTIVTIAKFSVALDVDIITTTAIASQRVTFDLGEADAKCSCGQ